MSDYVSRSAEELRLLMANYCVYRERCHSEVEQKLWDLRVPMADRDDLWLYLLENDFLNEQRFARAFAQGKFNQNSWGKIKIRHALRTKNVPTKLIEDALQQIELDDYLQRIEQLIARKYQAVPTDMRERQKLMRYLLGKGYEYEHIIPMLRLD
ncbi:MAG: regulatory protein RecX [Weeksellaceae bacterium]|nr:regulatory protein RecX [Weeksellaceae bacterium]